MRKKLEDMENLVGLGITLEEKQPLFLMLESQIGLNSGMEVPEVILEVELWINLPVMDTGARARQDIDPVSKKP